MFRKKQTKQQTSSRIISKLRYILKDDNVYTYSEKDYIEMLGMLNKLNMFNFKEQLNTFIQNNQQQDIIKSILLLKDYNNIYDNNWGISIYSLNQVIKNPKHKNIINSNLIELNEKIITDLFIPMLKEAFANNNPIRVWNVFLIKSQQENNTILEMYINEFVRFLQDNNRKQNYKQFINNFFPKRFFSEEVRKNINRVNISQTIKNALTPHTLSNIRKNYQQYVKTKLDELLDELQKFERRKH